MSEKKFDWFSFFNDIYSAEDDGRVSVNVSSSFLPRAKCKMCGQGPAFYYFKTKRIAIVDTSEFRKQYSKKEKTRSSSRKFRGPTTDYSRWHKISDFSLKVSQDSYSTFAHRAAKSVRPSKIEEFLSCECGSTVWGFERAQFNKRPESLNRRAKYNYPQRF